ncbi:MAG: OsmC family protein [Myxococcota bacterium]
MHTEIPTVTVELDVARGYRVEATTRGHTVILDEPTDLGGEDAGPTPLETMLAALGACTAMTLRMYATRKGWPLATVRVTLTHQQLARDACLDCPPDEAFPMAERITRAIEVTGGLDPDQIERLLDIANKCPVHRVLVRHPVVVTDIRVG